MLSSVANALRTLEYVTKTGDAGVSEIARSLGLTVGTAHRLVGTLTAMGFVEKNEAKHRYQPGPKIPELARLMHRNGGFLAQGHVHLERLMEQARETVNLGVLREGSVVYLDRVVTDQPLAVAVHIGSRVPAYCTSMGRALLAYSDEDLVADYLDNLEDHAAGHPQKPPSATRLRGILERVRETGIADDDGEFSPDIVCVAAPVLNERSRAIAAVSISGPSTRVRSRHDALAAMVRDSAKSLSELAEIVGDSIQR